jgi:16S rRNA G966 N2-methylase RsmD
MPNALYYGDNLDVLRNEIASESVDLIYLDPPFNSQASYNVLFKGPSGKGADAQIITLAELFQGVRPRIPRVDTAATFRERTDAQGQLL